MFYQKADRAITIQELMQEARHSFEASVHLLEMARVFGSPIDLEHSRTARETAEELLHGALMVAHQRII